MPLDTTPNYGLPAPAPGLPGADYNAEFATAMDAADAAIKVEIEAAYAAGGHRGVQYVRPDGSDSGDMEAGWGQTFDNAWATRGAALAALPKTPTTANGGVVVLSQGVHPAGQGPNCVVDEADGTVHFVGGGVASRLDIDATDQWAIKFARNNARWGGVRDIKVHSIATSTNHCGISIDTTKALFLDRIVGQNIGFTISPASPPGITTDATPALIYVTGQQSGVGISDWLKFRSIHTFNCSRTFVNYRGANGFLSQVVAENSFHEAIYIYQAGYWVNQYYLKASFAKNLNYMIRFELDPGAGLARPGTTLSDGETEVVNVFTGGANTNWGHHIYTNTGNIVIDRHKFIGGAADDPGTGDVHAVLFDGVEAKNCYVGQYTRNSQGGGVPQFRAQGGAANNSIKRRVAARTNNTLYGAGDVVRPASGNGWLYQATTSGTSGGSVPSFPTTYGGTVADGGVTWRAFSQAGDVTMVDTDVV
jgi:hypothetical protein